MALESCILGLFDLGKVRVWSFTVAAPAPDWKPVGDKWHRLLTYMGKRFDCRGVRVNEWHPGGHGWHIHWLTLGYLPVESVRAACRRIGFGRINVFLAGAGGEAARAYFVKHWMKDLGRGRYGMRKWACTGGYRLTRVRDIAIETPYQKWRRDRLGGFGGRTPFEVEQALRHEYLFGVFVPERKVIPSTPFVEPF